MSDDAKKKRKKKPEERGASVDYKRDLERLFSGGTNIPDRFKDVAPQLKAKEGTPEHEWDLAVDAVRATDGFREFVKAVTEFRKAGHKFPDDEELLIRVLDHPNERILFDLLTHLIELNSRRKLKRTAPIKSRLKTIRMACEDPKTHALVDELSEAI